MGKCVFCSAAGPLTLEHIWPVWLRSLIQMGDNPRAHRLAANATPLSWPIRGPLDVKVRRVCGDCNSGWMSRLESATKPVLTELILARNEVQLSEAGQRALAAWFTKTMLMELLLHQQPIVPIEQYRQFGTKVQPLPNSIILVGGFDGEGGRLIRAQHGWVRFAGGRISGAPDAVCATHLIGHLVFQIVIHDIRTYKVTVKNTAQTQGFLQQVWPLPRVKVVLPPAFVLNDAAYTALASNCGSRVSIETAPTVIRRA